MFYNNNNEWKKKGKIKRKNKKEKEKKKKRKKEKRKKEKRNLITEFEGNILASEFLIHSAESFNFVFNRALISLVEVNFEQTRSIETDTDALSNDFSRVYKIFENGFVNSSHGTATRALLEADFVVTCGFRENATLGNDNNVLTAEFLFQIHHQDVLDFVESSKLDERNKDDNNLFL